MLSHIRELLVDEHDLYQAMKNEANIHNIKT